ncbi:MAG: DUF5021 domain-containing protein [Oscillospiraceae bacterium]|nr:DUF5021 domain-containing protein [Oscillospiraceae bacterium]
MIKKLQALKAKKGFTLVELIVVIAIIGVLAAILVPTMLGMVTKSRVTSADSTAKSIKDNIHSFLTDADTAGFGMKRAADKTDTLVIQVGVTAPNEWQIDGITTTNFNGSGSKAWTGSTTAVRKPNDSSTGLGYTDLLALRLANTFPDMKQASIVAVINAGSCVYVAYTADTSDDISASGTGDAPAVTIASTGVTVPADAAWDTKTAGISGTNGYIVGTAPKIELS